MKRKPTFTEKVILLNVLFRLRHEWQNFKRLLRGEDLIPYSDVKPGHHNYGPRKPNNDNRR